MLTIFRQKIAETIAPELVERRNTAEREALTDPMTKLANRAAFDKAHTAARQNGEAFIIFDLNNFGRINKEHGHTEGDEKLKYYAGVIADVARHFKARAFRFGGDEFVIICRQRFAWEIRDAAERRAQTSFYSNFTVSISGAVGMTLTEADARLQSRKKARKAAESAILKAA